MFFLRYKTSNYIIVLYSYLAFYIFISPDVSNLIITISHVDLKLCECMESISTAEIKCVSAQPHGMCVPCWYFAAQPKLNNH